MPQEIIHQRELYDRRSGFDRRKASNPCKNGKRLKKEKRYHLVGKRSGWTRDTKWSSVLIDLLR
jgi:hypothetical protein